MGGLNLRVLQSIALLALFASCLPLLAIAAEGAQRYEPRASNTRMAPIRLVLRTTKTTLRAGQPLELTAYLENVSSDETFYVGSQFNFDLISSYHNMLLKVTDGKNRKVCDPIMSETSVWEVSSLTADEVARAYIALAPHMVHGINSQPSCRLRPGRYRITATYRDDFSQVWKQNHGISLKFPIWTRTVTSNAVTVKVLN